MCVCYCVADFLCLVHFRWLRVRTLIRFPHFGVHLDCASVDGNALKMINFTFGLVSAAHGWTSVAYICYRWLRHSYRARLDNDHLFAH